MREECCALCTKRGSLEQFTLNKYYPYAMFCGEPNINTTTYILLCDSCYLHAVTSNIKQNPGLVSI